LAERYISNIPPGRAGEMSGVASTVSYVAAEKASFITGQVINVNCGSTML
jgi:NAD(P)-dependent dehydrogenase (short-subunit alcohol dehydrogenase family)